MWLIGLAVAIGAIAIAPYVAYVLGYLLVQPAGSPAEKSPTTAVPVSVLVPTYNEAGIVEDTMARLCALEYSDEHLEIVVVDSSEDDTAERVRAVFADREAPTLTLIEEDDRGGVARAVNRGVAAASHDVIFRTDADARLDPGAVAHAVANLQDDRIGGVTGRQAEVLGDSELEETYRGLQARNQALESHLDSVLIVHGPCFAFRRDHFEPIPPDTIADDSAIGIGIRRGGSRVVMDPAMCFAEVGVSDLRGRRQRKDRRAMGLLQLLWRSRDLLGRAGAFGRVVLPFNWWFLVVSPWLTFLALGLAFGGLLLALGPLGLVAPVAFLVFVLLGSLDRLGPLGAFYAVFDAHVSLVIGTVRLLAGGGDGTWDVDEASREVLEGES